MWCKISNRAPPILITIALSLLLLGNVVDSRKKGTKKRPTIKTSVLTDAQKAYLEKIELAAKEGGLPEEEWKGIQVYDKDVCYEESCLQSALEIIQATNFTVDPCQPDMWYNYACARRVNGVDNINQLERLMKKVEAQTKSVLDMDLSPEKYYLIQEAQAYYHQCKNSMQDSDKQDVLDILSYLSENYGEWPILSNREPGSKFNWMNMVADLNRLERPGFLPFLLKVDATISTPHIQLGLGKTTSALNGADFETMMTKVQKYSAKKKPARLDQLKNMIGFLNLANYAAFIPSYTTTMNIDDLQEKTDLYLENIGMTATVGQVNWLEFFQRVFKGSDIEITGTSPNVTLPLDQIMSVIQTTFSATDPKAVPNLLNFQLATLLLQESTDLLSDLNSFKCTEESGSKDQICYARTTEIFGYSLGKTYLNFFYNDTVETPAIDKLFKNIKQGYIDVIDDTDWMEVATKDYLKDKIRSMKTYIAEPDWTKGEEGAKNIQKFYSGLQATASKDKNSSYPLNYLAVTSWQVAKKRGWAHKMSKLTRLRDLEMYDSEWSRYLGNVQAQYHKGINQARIEGGIVQAPLFGADMPGFMNYGGLGMVLGHEIGHSFDTQGRLYNKYGENLKDYWDEKSVKMYNKWVQIIIKDYGSESHQTSETSAETIDPWQTVNEDISDILGVYISYLSYQAYLTELKGNGEKEDVLPGLKSFAPQKLFYMKYTNMWCDKKDVQDQYNDLLQSHSAGNVRATMPLKRSTQFAETFGCPAPPVIQVK